MSGPIDGSGTCAHTAMGGGCHHDHRWRRRQVLLGAGALATAGLAGCLGEDDAPAEVEPVEPVALDAGQECLVCGMVIAEHFGPAGQVFYADDNPPDVEGPARFDSVQELVVYQIEREGQGWEKLAAFVTDYSRVEYDLVDREGRTHISTHAGEADFADASTLVFVIDSEVHGAMGADYLPFGDPDEAEAFADEHGGTVEDWSALVGR